MKVTKKLLTAAAVASVFLASTTAVFAADTGGGIPVPTKNKPEKYCAPMDGNCDGVVTCDEAIAPGWDWDESVKACVYTPTTAQVKESETPRMFNDLNHDGIITCDEAYAPGWDWDESIKACVKTK